MTEQQELPLKFIPREYFREKMNKPITPIDVQSDGEIIVVHINDIHIDNENRINDEVDENINLFVDIKANNCVFTNCNFHIEAVEEFDNLPIVNIPDFEESFFNHCSLDGDFYKGKFRKAVFYDCIFTEVTHFEKCDFQESIIENSTLDLITLNNTSFKNAKMNNVTLSESHLKQTDFTGAELYEINFMGTEFDLIHNEYNDSVDIKKATKFTSAILNKINLNGSLLDNAQMIGTVFNECDMSASNLIQTNLTGAKLVNIDLTEADLSEAILYSTTFQNVDLADANFTDAILAKSTFENVNFTNTNFSVTKKNMVERSFIGVNIDINTCCFIYDNRKIFFVDITRAIMNALIKYKIIHPSFVEYIERIVEKREQQNRDAIMLGTVLHKKLNTNNDILKASFDFLLPKGQTQKVRRKIIRRKIKHDTKRMLSKEKTKRKIEDDEVKYMTQKKRKIEGGKKNEPKKSGKNRKTRKTNKTQKW
jgi:hypothetical protein